MLCIQAHIAADLFLVALRHIAVRQTDIEHRHRLALRHQEFIHATACTAHNGVFLDSHQCVMARCHLQDQGFIQRFDKTHIHHSGIQILCRFQDFLQQGTEDQNCGFFPFTAHNTFTDLNLSQWLECGTTAAAARITHRNRAFAVVITGVQHLAALVFITRGHDHHVRQDAQEGEIKRALVCRTVVADNPGAVDSKQDRQFLNRDIVDHLIVGALQEAGVNCDNRLVTADSQPGGKGDGVLFSNRDIKILIREGFGEAYHTGTFAHGRGDRHQFRIVLCFFTQPVTEDF